MRLPNGRVRKLRRSSEDPGCANELTFSCYRRLLLLSRNRSRIWFLEALDAARRKHLLQLGAYVIMPEHVHVLFQHENPAYRIRTVLQSIKQPVMRRAIHHLRTHAPHWLVNLTNPPADRVHFWQPGGPYDRNVVSSKTAWSIVNYIHENPVKRGLVDDPLAWPWSSALWYAGQGEVLLPMDATPPT